MEASFQQGRYGEGAAQGVLAINALLAAHSPRGATAPTELSDRPIIL